MHTLRYYFCKVLFPPLFILLSAAIFCGLAALAIYSGARHYHITAITTPNDCGAMYVLSEEKAAIKQAMFEHPRKAADKARPLIIRANVDDTILVKFENELSRPAGIRIRGIRANVQKPDMAALCQDTTTYDCSTVVWYADTAGTFLFGDVDEASDSHELIGILVVEDKAPRFPKVSFSQKKMPFILKDIFAATGN